MHGRNDRNWLFVGVDASEGTCCLDNAGQTRIEHIRGQMLEVKVYVILFLADPAALPDLDSFGPADDVAR